MRGNPATLETVGPPRAMEVWIDGVPVGGEQVAPSFAPEEIFARRQEFRGRLCNAHLGGISDVSRAAGFTDVIEEDLTPFERRAAAQQAKREMGGVAVSAAGAGHERRHRIQPLKTIRMIGISALTKWI